MATAYDVLMMTVSQDSAFPVSFIPHDFWDYTICETGVITAVDTGVFKNIPDYPDLEITCSGISYGCYLGGTNSRYGSFIDKKNIGRTVTFAEKPHKKHQNVVFVRFMSFDSNAFDMFSSIFEISDQNPHYTDY